MSKYIKEDLEKMLREHTKNQAKLTEVELKKEAYEKRLEYAGSVNEETDKEIIESMQLSGQAYDSIHSNTNKISDTTANTAMRYQKEMHHVNIEDRAYLERKISELTEIKDELDKKIVRVKNLLQQLSAEEVEEIVKGIVAETGATSIKEMGMVMKSAKEKIGASADGKMISEVVKKILA